MSEAIENEINNTNETERKTAWQRNGPGWRVNSTRTGRGLFHRVGVCVYSASLELYTVLTHTRRGPGGGQPAQRRRAEGIGGPQLLQSTWRCGDRYVAASARSSSPGDRPWGRPQRRRLSPAAISTATRSENPSSSPAVETRRGPAVSMYTAHIA